MAKITADTLIADCLKLNPNAAEVLLSAGMHWRTEKRSPRRLPFTARISILCLRN